MPLNGIFILAELPGEIGERVRAINQSYDPKLARYKPPHLTLTGSSGAGPIPPSVGLEEMRNKLDHWMRVTNDPLLHGPVSAPPGAELNDPDQMSASYPTRFV